MARHDINHAGETCRSLYRFRRIDIQAPETDRTCHHARDEAEAAQGRGDSRVSSIAYWLGKKPANPMMKSHDRPNTEYLLHVFYYASGKPANPCPSFIIRKDGSLNAPPPSSAPSRPLPPPALTTSSPAPARVPSPGAPCRRCGAPPPRALRTAARHGPAAACGRRGRLPPWR